jgi:hypothetical protein
MRRLRVFVGYSAAVLTIAAAVLTPFLLLRVFTGAVARTGIRINEAYSGGEPAVELDRGGYRIVVHRPVRPQAPLQRLQSFVQVSWAPAAGLPETVRDVIDLDGDGAPDIDIRFRVPPDPRQPLEADVQALTAVTGSCRLGRGDFSSMICRAGDRIVARLPWLAE